MIAVERARRVVRRTAMGVDLGAAFNLDGAILKT